MTFSTLLALGSSGRQSKQEAAVEAKIAAALERIGQATRLLLWQAVKGRRLTPVQAQVLLYLHGHGEALSRVSQIAREFGLTAATVSDSVSALEKKGLLRRQASAQDARVAILELTAAGDALARRLQAWSALLQESIASFPPAHQEEALLFLMGLIERLQERGVITVARMCTTCRFFWRDAHPGAPAPHHCSLLDKPLAVSALRVDCPEYESRLAANAASAPSTQRG